MRHFLPLGIVSLVGTTIACSGTATHEDDPAETSEAAVSSAVIFRPKNDPTLELTLTTLVRHDERIVDFQIARSGGTPQVFECDAFQGHVTGTGPDDWAESIVCEAGTDTRFGEDFDVGLTLWIKHSMKAGTDAYSFGYKTNNDCSTLPIVKILRPSVSPSVCNTPPPCIRGGGDESYEENDQDEYCVPAFPTSKDDDIELVRAGTGAGVSDPLAPSTTLLKAARTLMGTNMTFALVHKTLPVVHIQTYASASAVTSFGPLQGVVNIDGEGTIGTDRYQRRRRLNIDLLKTKGVPSSGWASQAVIAQRIAEALAEEP